MSETDLLSKLLDAVVERVKPAVSIDVALWNAADIANYLRASKNQVMSRYAPRIDFPKAIRLPTPGGGHGHPLWRAREVIKWAGKYHDKVIQKRNSG